MPTKNFLHISRTGALLAICCLSFLLQLSAKTDIPDGGVSLLPADPIGSHGFWPGSHETNGGPSGWRQVIPVDHPDFSQAIRVTADNPDGRYFNGAVNWTINQPVSAGDVIFARIFFRGVSSDDETGVSFTTVYAQGPPDAYNKYVTRELSGIGEWQEYLLPFVVTEDLAATELSLQIGIGGGAKPQVYDIAGVEFIYYGTSLALEDLPISRPTYGGREDDAPWRTEAASRIEQYRKGALQLQLLDKNGNPVSDAEVEIKFKKHAYHFGSVVAANRIMGNGSDNEIYRERFLELFNQSGGENDTKWGPWEGEWGGAFTQKLTLDSHQWLKDRDIYTRGHVLVWPSKRNLPDLMQGYLPEGDPASADPAAKQVVLDHIDDITSTVGDLVGEWDVLNEPFDNHYLMDAFGDSIMLDWFNQARQNLPTQGLYINDYSILSGGGRNEGHQQKFEDVIQYLVDNDAPVTGMGMQGHFNESPTPIPILWDVLQRYSTAFPDLDIRITEFDIDAADEELQADYLRDFYTMLFSHPKTVGIQMWGFWEGQHWKANAGIFRLDWTEKLAAGAYRDLVFKDWWNDFEGTSNSRGQFNKKGFYGDYLVRVKIDGTWHETEVSHPTGNTQPIVALFDSFELPDNSLKDGNFESGNLNNWENGSPSGAALPPSIQGPEVEGSFYSLKTRSGDHALALGFSGIESGTAYVQQELSVPDEKAIALALSYQAAWQVSAGLNGSSLILHILNPIRQEILSSTTIIEVDSTSGSTPETGTVFRFKQSLEDYRGTDILIRLELSYDSTAGSDGLIVLIDELELFRDLQPELLITNRDTLSLQMESRTHLRKGLRIERSNNLADWETFMSLPAPTPEQWQSIEATISVEGDSWFYRAVETNTP